ncbi:unnamed protein product, partial [Brassica napus]
PKSSTRPQVRRDHPLSLSISISGGKETNKDSLSNDVFGVRIVVWRSVLSDGPGPSSLERGAREGESPVVPGPCRTTRRCLRGRVVWECSPNRAVNSVKAKYGRETDSEQVPRESQRVLEIVGREADGGRRCVLVGCGTEQSGPPIDSGRGPTRIKVVT